MTRFGIGKRNPKTEAWTICLPVLRFPAPGRKDLRSMKKNLVAAEKKFGKLSLHRETLKALSPSLLGEIAGGITEPQFPSQCSCCITECCCG